MSRDYIDPAEVVALRIFTEEYGHHSVREGERDGIQWSLDGIDRQGGYTESVWSFDTWAEAMAAIPEFRASLRLAYLRGEIRAQRISYGELAELQSLAAYIDPSDVELREWAGLPE